MTERVDPAPIADTSGDAAPPAPRDFAAFRLRGELPQVMRLSRRTLAIIGAIGGSAIGGALLFALQPAGSKKPENLYKPGSPNRAETVTSAPAAYDNVPKLGPPLPGDLGRPIVAAQREGDIIPVPPMGHPPATAPSPRHDAAERALQEREAAAGSQLFLGRGTSTEPGGQALRGTIELSGAERSSPERDPPTLAAARSTFMKAGVAKPFESAERIQGPTSPLILQSGSVIPAALITGIRSDLPGQVAAQVTQNVYDSPTGRILLIPQGARLIGEYDSEIAAGQQRLLLAWDRLILPGGRSIRLDRQPGTDVRGMAGLADRTDHHWGRMLGAALVSTLLGIGTDLVSSRDDVLVRALRAGSQDSVNEAGRRLVEREMKVPPTLTIRPGYVLRVLVTRDLILDEDAEIRR